MTQIQEVEKLREEISQLKKQNREYYQRIQENYQETTILYQKIDDRDLKIKKIVEAIGKDALQKMGVSI